ncbi:MAG: PIN domain nuclease of toxin-antitoxin system [Verrucomicrobiales bacterium]|jgi:PIN domain nuclease of toxin-antitoxin system
MNLLLDTNAWFWMFARPSLLSAAAKERLNQEEVVGVSPFSLIEIAQKNASPRANLELQVSLEEWFRISLPPGRVQLIPVTSPIAAKAYDVGDDFHGDPADRVIAATAIIHGLTLVTADRRLLSCDQVDTIPAR